MDLWFSEKHTPDVKLSIRVKKQLFCSESDYQRIDIFDSEEFGRILSLDGNIMLTERDAFIYNEMIVHVPMAVHPCIEKVLVIGAGDGICFAEGIAFLGGIVAHAAVQCHGGEFPGGRVIGPQLAVGQDVHQTVVHSGHDILIILCIAAQIRVIIVQRYVAVHGIPEGLHQQRQPLDRLCGQR